MSAEQQLKHQIEKDIRAIASDTPPQIVLEAALFDYQIDYPELSEDEVRSIIKEVGRECGVNVV